MRKLRVIYRKAKENLEERGLETFFLAYGLSTWTNKRGAWTPAAPVLLRHADLKPIGAAHDDFELTLQGEMEVNPTLLHVLKVDFDCSFKDQELLDQIDGTIDEAWELNATYDWLANNAKQVAGFAIDRRLVAANFTYAKLPMVRDLETSSNEELAANDIVAAIAGDETARESLSHRSIPEDQVLSPDHTPLSDEFLVLDADASQNYAINAALAGENLIVRGPPGTGKSQTIANLIASLMARGKRVLFVAEKRAAIDAVLKRLEQQQIGDLVLNLHGGVSNRRLFAQEIGRSLEASRTIPPFDFSEEQRRLQRRRDELNQYVTALHARRDPWNVSVYGARAALLDLITTGASSDLRLINRVLDDLDAERSRICFDNLEELALLDGFKLHPSPWHGAAVSSVEDVEVAYSLTTRLAKGLEASVALMMAAAADSGVGPPRTLRDGQTLVQLWGETEHTLSVFRAGIYDEGLEENVAILLGANKSLLSRLSSPLLSAKYRTAKRTILSYASDLTISFTMLRTAAQSALGQKRAWTTRFPSVSPSIPRNLDAVTVSVRDLTNDLDALGRCVHAEDLYELPLERLRDFFAALISDRTTLVQMPEIHRLRHELTEVGLQEFLEEIENSPSLAPLASRVFRYVWLSSILDRVLLTDPSIGAFVGESHAKRVEEFKLGDREHIASTTRRIRRICAERVVAARDTHREQAQLVQRQANLKRKHMPIRDFVREAPDVLLALKPCWAMSPLVVSQLLPNAPLFDLVIFDEASQVTPADAIPSILRGRQIVVAGDPKQLPPTAFFASDSTAEEDDPLVTQNSGTQGFESILDALTSVLQFRTLAWHYRSRDERLIAFSNAHIYDRMLTTFAGVGGPACMEHVLVEWQVGSDTNSPAIEVERVVDLILNHAVQRPDESLGVIAMGVKHSNRIQEALRQRLHDNPSLAAQLADFFDEDRDEHFFAKNLERVQGDERDAIILTIGYGKNDKGQLPYHFGPLLSDGGERRLNVAVTRAKQRMTLVSSFSSHDMDPDRSTAEGVRMLRYYLQYVESGGANLGDVLLDKPALNPFEIDVRNALEKEGMQLVAQYGSSGYRIDFAAKHPEQPGRFVLAIECDGASYHSQQSARDRDRLRQEQLERLGWRFHRIWSTDWFNDKEGTLNSVMAAYRTALSDPEPHHSAVSPISDPPTMMAPLESGADRAPRPHIVKGLTIGAYTARELSRLVDWICSDGVLRTEDELVSAVMEDLGFMKRGQRIVATIREAIHLSRGS